MLQNRRVFLARVGAAAMTVRVSLPLDAAAAPAQPPAISAKDALSELLAGNLRFANGTPVCKPTTARRAELAQGQNPFAIILGCSDSRVPVETIFDHEPGDIFTVRVAGNFADTNGIGSIEYGTAVLKAPLLIVLGHASCGAVKAATEYVKSGTVAPGHIQDLVLALTPAARAARERPGDWLANAVEANVRMTVSALEATPPIIDKAVKDGTLTIAGGVYDLHSGRVRMLSS
ncbi:MAG: carbonic anhydrase [Vulcanimicrobiaceae bacterium]